MVSPTLLVSWLLDELELLELCELDEDDAVVSFLWDFIRRAAPTSATTTTVIITSFITLDICATLHYITYLL
jgi:hypothetical protein